VFRYGFIENQVLKTENYEMNRLTENPRPMTGKAFDDFQIDSDGNVSVWVNQTMLPSVSIQLKNRRNPTLIDIGMECGKTYRTQTSHYYENDDCSLNLDFNPDCDTWGAELHFSHRVAGSVAQAFRISPNRALAKIGYLINDEIRDNEPDIAAQDRPLREITWRGAGYFVCGANAYAQCATICLNRSTLDWLARKLPAGTLRTLFAGLAMNCDPNANEEEVDEELEEMTHPLDEELWRLQADPKPIGADE